MRGGGWHEPPHRPLFRRRMAHSVQASSPKGDLTEARKLEKRWRRERPRRESPKDLINDMPSPASPPHAFSVNKMLATIWRANTFLFISKADRVRDYKASPPWRIQRASPFSSLGEVRLRSHTFFSLEMSRRAVGFRCMGKGVKKTGAWEITSLPRIRPLAGA